MNWGSPQVEKLAAGSGSGGSTGSGQLTATGSGGPTAMRSTGSGRNPATGSGKPLGSSTTGSGVGPVTGSDKGSVTGSNRGGIPLERMLGAMSARQGSRVPKFPWESQSLPGFILGTAPRMPWLWRPPDVVLPPWPERDLVVKQAVDGNVQGVKRKRAYESVVNGLSDDSLAVQIAKWLEILELALTCSTVGQQVATECERGPGGPEAAELLRDVFASRSTRTLSTRACAILLYLKWVAKNAPTGSRPFPYQEALVYRYLRWMASSGAAPTRGSSFLKAVNFTVHVLGFHIQDGMMQSARIIGCAHRLFLTKRPLCQKDALTVAMVSVLELASCVCRLARARALAGYCCFLLYGRLRVSDGGRIKDVVDTTAIGPDGLERGFLEARALATKTGTTKEKKTTFLPVVLSVESLTGTSWWRNFLAARSELGMPPITSALAEDGEFVPLLSSADDPSHRSPVGSDEVSGFLALLMNCAGFPKDAYRNTASHSLKATLLSWCAKAGSSLTDRQLLGYHVVSGQYSALNYGRDNLSGPMECLGRVFSSVSSGHLRPDKPRGDRWAEPMDRKSAAQQLEELFDVPKLRARLSGDLKVDDLFFDWTIPVENPGGLADVESGEPLNVTDAVFEEHGSDAEAPAEKHEAEVESDDEEGQDALAVAVLGKGPVVVPELPAVRHINRKTVHYVSVTDVHRTGCGALITDAYEAYPLADGAWPRCHRNGCFPL